MTEGDVNFYVVAAFCIGLMVGGVGVEYLRTLRSRTRGPLEAPSPNERNGMEW